jgi:plasmid stabilization system protein ParE
MRLQLSREADADLDELLEYGIQNSGLEVGREYYFSFDGAFGILRTTPEAGQVDSETSFRRWHHGNHRIFIALKGAWF